MTPHERAAQRREAWKATVRKRAEVTDQVELGGERVNHEQLWCYCDLCEKLFIGVRGVRVVHQCLKGIERRILARSATVVRFRAPHGGF